MKKIPILLMAIMITASPIVAQAAIVTYGDLQYDPLSGPDIVNTVTGTRYLNLSEGKDWTYAETLDKIANGGYSNYHIASQTEAYAFANAFPITTLVDTAADDNHVRTSFTWTDGDFGDNFQSSIDYVWFTSATSGQAGYVELAATSKTLVLKDNFATVGTTDRYAAGGASAHTPIAWLLVNDVTPVPVPPAIWLMGSALVGLAGFARRKVGA